MGDRADSQQFVIPVLAGIGNALLAEPMVRQLRAGLGRDARVSVVAPIRAMGEPLRRIGGVNVVIAGRGAWRMFLAMRSMGAIDTLIVPFPSNRWQYNVLALRSGARRVILHAYPPGQRAWFSSVGQRIDAVRGLHDVNQNLRLLSAVGIEPRLDDPPRFPLEKDDRRNADDLLREVGIGRRPFFAVHAGSARTILAAAKRWPAENYALLIDAIRRETGWDVALLEGPDERGVADEIVQAGGLHAGRLSPGLGADESGPEGPGLGGVRVVRLNGPLGDAAAVLARAKLYVGTDSGLAHLAAAVGTHAVTLFAPADPDRVAPFGQRDLVVKPDKPCSPCFLYPWESTRPKMRCRPPFCVHEITVEMVLEKVRAALSDTRSRPAGKGTGEGTFANG